jgi:hypothetical protein
VLAVSELITIDELQRFMDESGYGRRRSGENIDRANTGDPMLPACVTFDDALAYCAYLERQTGAPVRLLTYTEHRAIRPNPSDMLGRTASDEEVREWHAKLREMRFPGAVQFDPAALHANGKLKWVEDYPPGATWREPLPWVMYQGLRFIDAWDAAEWTTSRDHNAAVTINWDGDLPNTSWGAYKQLKTCFRVVMDVALDA